MKSILSLLTIVMFITFGHAQDSSEILTNKKGKPVLPQKGQFAFGISANPFFTYAGNIFNLDGYNGLDLYLFNGNRIVGKYMITDHSAVRVGLSISNSNSSTSNIVIDDRDPEAKVTDTYDAVSNSQQIVLGYEWRRGTDRLQVNYGGELMFGSVKSERDYSYGNDFGITVTRPRSTYWPGKTSGTTSSRPLESKFSDSFFGVRGFVGAEYFFAPRMAIGTEVGLSYTKTKEDKSKFVTEFWDFTNNVRDTRIDESGEGTETAIDTDILNGQIYLLFYF